MADFKIIKDVGRVLFAFKKELRCYDCYKELTDYNLFYCEASKKLFCYDCEHKLRSPCYTHVSHKDFMIDKIELVDK